MKRRVLSAIGLGMIAATMQARAADFPVKAPIMPASPSWAGFYLGAGVGFRSSDTQAEVTSAINHFPGASFDLLADQGCSVGLPCALGDPFNGTAFRVAPYLGYNWQIGPNWVAGLEADFGFADQTTTRQGADYPAPSVLGGGAPDSFAVKTGWDASVRARAGVLVDPAVLLYLTGGPAWLHVESTSNCSMAMFGSCAPDFGPSVITDSTTKLGFTVGGGIEAMLWANWVLRGEYRYSDFGTIGNTDDRFCSAACGAPFTAVVTYDVKLRTHTATFGLAYKFGDSSKAWASAAPLARRAFAQAPASVPSWNGFYLGLGAGVRATTTTANLDSVTQVFPGFGPFNAFTNCSNFKGSGCYFSDSLDGTGFRFSPYAGFNWQLAAQWVAGIEADVGLADQKTTLAGKYAPGTPFGLGFGAANDAFSVRTTWDASLRGRIGYLVTPTVLVYGAAGPALMHIEQSSTCDTGIYNVTPPGGPVLRVGDCAPNLLSPADITDSSNRLGVMVAGGFEAKLWTHWVARAEYAYADFGTLHFTDVRSCPGPGLTIGNTTFGCAETDLTTDSLRVRTHTGTFGLAYKFD